MKRFVKMFTVLILAAAAFSFIACDSSGDGGAAAFLRAHMSL